LSKLYQLQGWSEENAVLLAEWVFDNYKYDSVDDVIACLSNPPQTYDERGNVETNWRLTPDRIQKWMAVQLEKTAIKRENQKYVPALELLPEDKLQELQNALKDAPVIAPITEQEIKDEGKEMPKKKEYIPPDQNYIRLMALKGEYGRDHCDLHTGRTLPGHPTWEEFLELMS